MDPTTGKMHFFRWKVLFLGINDAARIFTVLCAPIIRYCRQELGLICSIYRDDLFTGGITEEIAIFNKEKTKKDFKKAGWMFNEKKSRNPSQESEYLGFIVDMIDMKFKILKEKREKVLKLLEDFLYKSFFSKLPVKALAKVTGSIIALSRAVGPVARLMTRHLYGDVMQARTWSSWIWISQKAIEEIRFWINHLKVSNGFAVIPSLLITRIVYNVDRAKDYEYHTGGDASNKGGYGAELSSEGEVLVHFWFSEEERKQSSTWREIRVIEKLYLSEAAKKFANSRVLHSCDNLNVTRILENGSRKRKIQEMVQKIYLRCVELGIVLEAKWRPRPDSIMKLMDHGSRQPFLPHEEFSLGFDDYCNLVGRFGIFDLDLMASNWNKKAPKYFSKCFEVNSAGVNIFEQRLNPDWNYYILPPPRLALQVLFHLQMFQAKAVVLLPLWSSAAWFSRIFPSSHLPEFAEENVIFRPFFVADDRAESGLFKGRIKFDYITMKVNFRGLKKSREVWEPKFRIDYCLKRGCAMCSRVCHIGNISTNLIGAYDFLPLKSIMEKAVKKFFQTKQYKW